MPPDSSDRDLGTPRARPATGVPGAPPAEGADAATGDDPAQGGLFTLDSDRPRGGGVIRDDVFAGDTFDGATAVRAESGGSLASRVDALLAMDGEDDDSDDEGTQSVTGLRPLAHAALPLEPLDLQLGPAGVDETLTGVKAWPRAISQPIPEVIEELSPGRAHARVELEAVPEPDRRAARARGRRRRGRPRRRGSDPGVRGRARAVADRRRRGSDPGVRGRARAVADWRGGRQRGSDPGVRGRARAVAHRGARGACRRGRPRGCPARTTTSRTSTT